MQIQPDVSTDVFIDFDVFLTEVQAARLIKMPRYQDVIASKLRASPAVAYKSFYFISHRWEDPDDPDPTRWQLEALRQFASELKSNGQLPSCFWYDFSSLPQGVRTAEEQAVFSKGLAGLNALSVGCETIALISGSDEPLADFTTQLKRGWILCEMIVACRSAKWTWWFHQPDGEIFAAARSRTMQFTPVVENVLQSMPVHDEAALLHWLHQEGVSCTNNAELGYLAGRIVEFSYHINHDKAIVLPALATGTLYQLADHEIAQYCIDAAGKSPYLPGCTVIFERRPQGGYNVEVLQDNPSKQP